MEIKDRIRQLMESQHTSQKVFAQTTGISEASLSGVFNGRTKPSINMIEAIHSRFPEVSVEWLMFGTGDMKVGNNASASGESGKSEDDAIGAPTLFDASTTDSRPQMHSSSQSSSDLQSRTQPPLQPVIKYVEKPARKITEIRIFYDDQTWETFVPKE